MWPDKVHWLATSVTIRHENQDFLLSFFLTSTLGKKAIGVIVNVIGMSPGGRMTKWKAGIGSLSRY